jgi:hypothetical protein
VKYIHKFSNNSSNLNCTQQQGKKGMMPDRQNDYGIPAQKYPNIIWDSIKLHRRADSQHTEINPGRLHQNTELFMNLKKSDEGS